MKKPLASVVAVLALVASAIWPSSVKAVTTLNPQNPFASFQKEGGETAVPGSVLTLIDTSIGDFVAFFGADNDANPGIEIDVVTTFQIRSTTLNNADVGNRVAINDGTTRSAIASCIVKNGERGIGLLSSQGSPSQPNSYPVFVPVDWRDPVTIRLRRHANGDAELIEINGVPPNPPAILPAAQCPALTRPGSSVDFGCRSVEAQCTVEYAAFRSELTATSVEDAGLPGGAALLPPAPNPSRGAGPIQLSFRLEDHGSVQLEIFDVSGRSVKTLARAVMAPGVQLATWNGRSESGEQVAPGTYFLRLRVGDGYEATERITIVR